MTNPVLYFYIQKTLLNLVLPPSGMFLLILSGLLLRKTVHKKLANSLVITGLMLLYLFSINLVSTPLIRSLENDHQPLDTYEIHPDAIVVLTAGTKDLAHLGKRSFPSSTSLVRLLYGMELLSKYKNVPMIICGGKGDPSKSDLSEADALGKAALELGVPDDMLIVEDRSLNTIEGGQNVRSILDGNGTTVLLISSASHMGRAVSLFAKADLNVIPAPTDYRGEAIRFSLYSFIPASEHMGNSATAIYEYLARFWYKLIL